MRKARAACTAPLPVSVSVRVSLPLFSAVSYACSAAWYPLRACATWIKVCDSCFRYWSAIAHTPSIFCEQIFNAEE